jgi:hypothetical protein
MTNPDFSQYSLALIKDNEMIFSSKESCLRTLAETVAKFKGKLADCVLHDKVVGLAAARLIVYSGMISSVMTPLLSMQAKELLENENIAMDAEAVVDNIMNKDRSGICPMEKKAQETDDNKEFSLELFKNLNLVDNTV